MPRISNPAREMGYPDALPPMSTSPPLKRKRDSGFDATDTKASKKQDVTSRSQRKQKSVDVVDLTNDDGPAFVHSSLTAGKKGKTKSAAPASAETPKKKSRSQSSKSQEEKRLAKFREKPPQKYWDYHSRALTQRMFVLNRNRGNAEDCPHGTPKCPSETVELAGSTGNVYTINITHKPSCTCPDFTKGNKQCKHIIYVLVQVLKAPSHLAFQLAFLTSELREIFDNAGPLPVETISDEDKDGNRRPVEGDCPICCCDLDDGKEEVVWCKAACGNNLHKTCFDQWAASRRGQKVTCPYCRTAWSEGGDLKTMSKKGAVGREGYVNLASELGLSGQRDYSSYNSFWVRRQMREGLIEEDWYEPEY
ncbi:ring finger domain-containing protein 10 [Elsinoe australis]|uniref:Ring finger domain-containing protein 10 n=1 Tax=Elsinoe australis TaxID=40998 RepID=A0A4V6DSZ9_9PEZI|nr:ring finger domain-containing protein 10 [Elsinoe australis]